MYSCCSLLPLPEHMRSQIVCFQSGIKYMCLQNIAHILSEILLSSLHVKHVVHLYVKNFIQEHLFVLHIPKHSAPPFSRRNSGGWEGRENCVYLVQWMLHATAFGLRNELAHNPSETTYSNYASDALVSLWCSCAELTSERRVRKLQVQHLELSLPWNNEIFLTGVSQLSQRRGAGGRFMTFVSNLRLSRAFQGSDSPTFLPVVVKAAVIDLGKGGIAWQSRRARLTTDQILRCKCVHVCVFTSFLGLLSDPGQVNLLPIFQLCGVGGVGCGFLSCFFPFVLACLLYLLWK